MNDELEKAKTEIDRLNAWIVDLHSGMYVNCVYCGHRYGPKEITSVSMADMLKAHVEQCPKHPMSKLKAENSTLRTLLPKLNAACVYCGEVEIAKCPVGFPGCAQADDLLVGEDEGFRRLLAERGAALNQRDILLGHLVKIHSWLGPEDVKLPDGRTMWFNNPEAERAAFRELCKAIRDIPDTFDAPLGSLDYVTLKEQWDKQWEKSGGPRFVPVTAPAKKPHSNKSTTHEERFFHVRVVDRNPEDDPYLVWKTVFARKEEQGWRASASRCSPNDLFNRKVGRTVARRRYFRNLKSSIHCTDPRGPTFADAVRFAEMGL